MPTGPRPKAPKSCGRDGVGGGGVAAQALAPCGRGGGEEPRRRGIRRAGRRARQSQDIEFSPSILLSLSDLSKIVFLLLIAYV
jgi:hypothetical protein